MASEQIDQILFQVWHLKQRVASSLLALKENLDVEVL